MNYTLFFDEKATGPLAGADLDLMNTVITSTAPVAVIQPVPDLDNVHYLLMIGANPAVSGMTVVQVPRTVETLQNIRKRGGDAVRTQPGSKG